MNSCGIYKIENLITHKVYVGQSIHIFQRWREHFHHDNMPWVHSLLYDDFAAYGIENFSFQILELCEEEQLNEREVYYIEKYNAYEDGLNSNMGNQPIYDEEAKKIKEKRIKLILVGENASLSLKIKIYIDITLSFNILQSCPHRL